MVDFKVADYGQEKDFDATDGELEIYQKIIDTISGAGFDASPVRLTAKSKGYLSAVIGPSDVARFKSPARRSGCSCRTRGPTAARSRSRTSRSWTGSATRSSPTT